MPSLITEIAVCKHGHPIAMHEELIMSSVSDEDSYGGCHLEEAVANELEAFIVAPHASFKVDLFGLLIIAIA